MKVLAIDPGTKCGWAHSDGPSGVFDLSIRRDESRDYRLIRLRSYLNQIHDANGIEMVAFEAARNAGPNMQGALVVASEFQSVIKTFCIDKGLNYRGRSPTEIKKHATGKGNAKKAAMVEAAEAKWPDKQIQDDNEADALLLLSLTLEEMG